MNATSMISVLSKIEDELPGMLRDDIGWLSLDINYHPPLIQRLWRQHGEYRVYLHRTVPCPRHEALMHPHPWPSAVRVIDGVYEMGIGTGPGPLAPPISATIYQVGGLFVYEMLDPHAWHYVRAVSEIATSVMVTATPWPDPIEVPKHPPLGPLTPQAHVEMLNHFREIYP